MKNSKEKGQALAETAVFSMLVVLLGFAVLALIPLHRSRSAATSAAYACAQFVSQSVDSLQAVAQAEAVARRTLDAYWSGSGGSAYDVQAWSGGDAGTGSGCTVSYRSPILFNDLLGLNQPQWRSVSFYSRTESWKARWP